MFALSLWPAFMFLDPLFIVSLSLRVLARTGFTLTTIVHSLFMYCPFGNSGSSFFICRAFVWQ